MKPDISCSIEAVGPDGEAINEGAAVSYPPTDANVTLRFLVTNPSSARTGQFWLRPCVRVNGDKAYDPPVEMINLEPGEDWRHEFSQPVGEGTESWEASLLADINDFVDESDERNNHAYLSFSARRST